VKLVKVILELGKVRITIAVTLSTLTGYILATGKIDTGIILPSLGIFLLACGSSAINHYQEREMDAKMKRTAHRPIPSGRISPNGALIVALIFVFSGSYLLYKGSGFLGLQLGILALIWYNAIYTPLKRRTAFAVIPGAVIGAIPPVVGWVAGGGKLLDPEALMLAFFFFIWQVPHFWILLLKYGDEYEKAGYPTLSRKFSTEQIKKITFVWTTALIVTSFLLPLYGIISSQIILILLVVTSIVILISFTDLLRNTGKVIKTRSAFMKINIYFLLVMLYMWIDKLALA